MIIANTPSLGLVIGLPIGLLCIAGGLAAIRFANRADTYDAPILRWGGTLVVAAAVIAMALSFWPWKWEYHSWQPVDGRVEKISSRFVSAGDKGGTNQRFVVVVGGQPYGVDDTRASLLKVGDTVHLKCKREFVWGSGSNGWGCNWNGGPS
jgi:hypothetical protein